MTKVRPLKRYIEVQAVLCSVWIYLVSEREHIEARGGSDSTMIGLPKDVSVTSRDLHSARNTPAITRAERKQGRETSSCQREGAWPCQHLKARLLAS